MSIDNNLTPIPNTAITNISSRSYLDKISNSEIYVFNKCLTQYEYEYINRLEPNLEPTYFTKGKMLHHVMAELLLSIKQETEVPNLSQYISGLFSSYVQENSVQYPPTDNELSILTKQAIEVYNNFLEHVDVVEAVEQEFFAKLPESDVILHGFIDAVVVDKEGKRHVIEFKTGRRAWSDVQWNMAPQDTRYALAWEVLTGDVVDQSTYYFFLPSRLETRVREHSQDSLMESYRDLIANWEVREKVRELGPGLPMNMGWTCAGCPFVDVCAAKVSGSDWQYVLEANFREKEERTG